ncbi:MAG: cupin domain-containing protein [bacterium]
MSDDRFGAGSAGDASASGHTHDEVLETAALYALGAIPSDEARAFEAHLRGGCPDCAAAVRSFLDITASLEKAVASPALEPSPALRDELLRRAAQEKSDPTARAGAPAERPAEETQVWKRWQESGGSFMAPGLFTLRAAEGNWQDTAVPGVSVKPLFVDKERDYVTMLVRMAPGSSYPRHTHAGAEECFVLEGNLRVAGRVLQPGDYQRADAASDHGEQSTDDGCLLLIVSSQHDELF